MVNWHWNITRDGAIRFSLILLLFSFSYQNFTWLNSHFSPLIPVGYILLGISSIFVLRHVYRTIRWYRIWLNGKRHQKYEKLSIHICLYLVIISVFLSVPMSIDGTNSATAVSTNYEAKIHTMNKTGYNIQCIEMPNPTQDSKVYMDLSFVNTNANIKKFFISPYIKYLNGTSIIRSDGVDFGRLQTFTVNPYDIYNTQVTFDGIDTSAKPVLYISVGYCDGPEAIQRYEDGDTSVLKGDMIVFEL